MKRRRPRRRSPLPFLLLAVAVVGCAFAVAVATVVPMEADSPGGQDQASPTPTLDEAERDKLLDEAKIVADAVQQNIYENAHVALDQKAYQKKYDDLTARYETLKARLDELNEQISQTQAQKAGVEDFLTAFEKMPEQLTEFSLDNFNALTDYLTVNSEGNIDVTFRNGQTIKA